ncbi:MAG: hypothetical protein ACRC9X_05230 [Bacteroidales bacterium]
MTIAQAIRQAANDKSVEMYCKICTVDSIDATARTCDVSPIDESTPILGARLQANTQSAHGIVLFPKVGSFVVVAFITPAVAAVVLADEVEQVDIAIGKSRIIIKDGIVEINEGGNGGIVIAEKLVKQLEKATARIDGIIDAINNAVPIPMDGGAGLQTTMKLSLAALVDKESYADIENDKVKH